MKFIKNEEAKYIDLKWVSYEEANKAFMKNEKVYIRLMSTGYLVTEESDEELLPVNNNIKLFIEKKIDDSKIIVTRHDVIAEYFMKELGINAKRVNYARIYEVKGKDVYGVIPLSFMGEANSLTTVHSKVNDDSIDKMTLEEFKKNIIDVRKYKVQFERLEV